VKYEPDSFSHGTPLLRLIAGALGLLLALPAGAYDFPLSSNAIRDAYFWEFAG